MSATFTDFLKQQRDLAHLLLSDPWLSEINIAMRHELLEETALARLPDKTLAAEVLVYITPRNPASGKKGCGIIIERPEFNVLSPNVTGPQGDVIVEFLILSDRLQNESPTKGTGRTASQVAQRLLDLLHGHADEGIGTYQASGNAISAAQDFEPLDAYRVRLNINTKRQQTSRCAVIASSQTGSNLTLTCATADAQIYFTLGAQDSDGNWLEPATPAPSNTGGGAQLYSAPFAVATGQLVRAAAFHTNYNQSPVRRIVAA